MSPSLFVVQLSVEAVVVHKAMFLHPHRTVGRNEKNNVIMFKEQKTDNEKQLT